MATLTSVLHPDHGFHPIATTAIEVPAAFEQCAVHLVYTLPPLVFVDKYELANHDQSYSFQFWGVSDLEHPVFAVEQSDSILLVNVKKGAQVSVPLHLRCGTPGAGFEETRLGWPVGFLACPASGESIFQPWRSLSISYTTPQCRARHPQTCQGQWQSSSRNLSPSFP
jgi:hypothetical protein